MDKNWKRKFQRKHLVVAGNLLEKNSQWKHCQSFRSLLEENDLLPEILTTLLLFSSESTFLSQSLFLSFLQVFRRLSAA